MNNEEKYSYQVWWSSIERLARSFVDFVNKEIRNEQMEIVLEKGNMDKVRYVYRRNMMSFKRKVYGKRALEHKIDRHKIIALYIKSLLEVSPFFVRNRIKQEKHNVMDCPNEYFSLELMFLILTAWNKKKSQIDMDKHERNWFIILLNHYRLDLNTLDILSLAQIIYYIENKYIK